MAKRTLAKSTTKNIITSNHTLVELASIDSAVHAAVALHMGNAKDGLMMTTQQAADYTGFSASFLKKARMSDKAKLRAGKVLCGPPVCHIDGTHLYYRRSDLDEWIASRKKKMEGGVDNE